MSIDLSVNGNPWIGTDRPLVATIRERVDAPPPVTDGPPLSAPEATRFRLRLADGVEEAYAAVYKQDGPPAIVVYGLRFANATSNEGLRRDTWIRENPKALR